MACTACNSILNGIYKHAPMTKAQINDTRNRDREIVVLTDQLFTDIPSDLESLIKVLHNDDLLEPTRFTPIFDMISDGNDNVVTSAPLARINRASDSPIALFIMWPI